MAEVNQKIYNLLIYLIFYSLSYIERFTKRFCVQKLGYSFGRFVLYIYDDVSKFCGMKEFKISVIFIRLLLGWASSFTDEGIQFCFNLPVKI